MTLTNPQFESQTSANLPYFKSVPGCSHVGNNGVVGDMHQVQPLIWLKQVKMKLLLLALRSPAVVVQRHHKAWIIVRVVQAGVF